MLEIQREREEDHKIQNLFRTADAARPQGMKPWTDEAGGLDPEIAGQHRAPGTK